MVARLGRRQAKRRPSGAEETGGGNETGAALSEEEERPGDVVRWRRRAGRTANKAEPRGGRQDGRGD